MNTVDEMETPAPSATTDGVDGMNAIQHEAWLVLGKGKVDGSIPFGSTISFNDLASTKDMLPGSNEPGDPVAEFMQKGGKITVLPPGTAMHGHSPHQKSIVLAPSYLAGMSYSEAVKSFFDGRKSAAREKAYKNSNAKAREKACAIHKAKAETRRARIRQMMDSGASFDAIAAAEGCGRERARKLVYEIRRAG